MMTMMMSKKRCSVVFLFFLPLAAFTQEKDFGIWYGISGEHKLTDKLDIELSTSIRTFDRAAKIEEAFIEGGLSYNFNKYLNIASSYRLTKNIEDDDSYYFRHKVFFDFKGSLPVSALSFSCRLRFQTRTKTYIEDEGDKIPDYTGRIKLKAIYKTPSFPVNPYIYAETFCPMFSDKTRTIEKNRFAGGIVLRISKRHSFEAEYIFQRDYLPDISDINIISVSYNVKF
jgi:hypothetical protein